MKDKPELRWIDMLWVVPVVLVSMIWNALVGVLFMLFILACLTSMGVALIETIFEHMIGG